MGARDHGLGLAATTIAAASFMLGCGGSAGHASSSSSPAPDARCAASSVAPPDERARATFLVQTGHSGVVNTLALGRDGRILASGSLDSTLRIWDVSSGLLLARLRAPGAAHTLSMSADGSVVAYAGEPIRPETIVVRVLATGETRTISPFGPFVLSPDGKTLAVGRDGVALYDATTGALRRTIPIAPMAGEIEAIAIDETASKIGVAFGATVEKGEVALVDAGAGRVIRRVQQPGGGAMQRTAHTIAFANGLLAMQQAGGRVHVLAATDDAQPREIAGGISSQLGAAGATLWRLDGGAHDRKGRLSSHDAKTGAETAAIDLAGARDRMAVSADGRTAVLAWHDPLAGDTMEVLDLGRLKAVRTLEGRQTGVRVLALDAAGTQLAVGSQGALSHWRLPDGEMRLLSRDRDIAAIGALAFDAAGRQLATADRGARIVVREAGTGRPIRRWGERSFDEPFWLAFRGSSSDLVVVERGRVSAGSAVMTWDLSGPLPAAPAKEPSSRGDFAAPPGRKLAQLPWQVESAALSPDGTKIAASGRPIGKLEELHVAVVDASNGTIAWDQDRRAWGGVLWSEVAFSARGEHVLLSSFEPQPLDVDKQAPSALRAFDAATGAVVREGKPGTQGPLAARGETIAIGGEDPVLVDAATFAVRTRLDGVDRPVRAVTAHPKLDAFLLGDDSGTTTLVSTSGEVRALLVATSRGDWVAATPSGAFRASLDGARSVAWTFTPPLEGFSFEQFAARFERPDVVRTWLEGGAAGKAEPIARPPSLRIDGGARTTDVAGASVSINASVASGGLVERVRAFVNGRPAADTLVCKASADVKLDVPVPGGRSRVAVIAYDSTGLASNAAMLDVVSKRAADRPALWAVTVGVSRYPSLGPEHQLDAADDDARAVAAALRGLAGPNRPFTSAHVTTLLDADATPASIERAVASLSQMRPDDLGVVFFAGHGVRLSDGKMVFLSSRASFGEDAARREGVGWEAIEASLAKTPGRVLMLLDACHAGHVSTERIAQNEALAQALASRGRAGVLVFAASRGAQLSYEVSEGGAGMRGLDLAWEGAKPRAGRPLATGHGLFTAAVLEALAGEAPDRDRSGAVEASELVDYVTERVRAASNGKQTPWVARREMFGDFAVAPTSSATR